MPHSTTNRSFVLPYDIRITVGTDHATLSSRLREQLVDDDSEYDPAGNACAHALESLLLALAARGVDLGAPAVAQAVQDAAHALAEYLCQA